MKHIFALIVFTLLLPACGQQADKSEPAETAAATAAKPQVIVSTDIGGSDPDDFQSMVHFLLYADRFDIRGLVSSPPKVGRAEHLLEVIDAYEKDYTALLKHSDEYPSPDALRAVTKQGAVDPQSGAAPEEVSEGAQLIIDEALKKEKAPLFVLVWGSITDVAQALHAKPEITERLRVYSIGSWNTRHDSLARNYIYDNHKDLYWIESNTTFRGMYMGGYQEGDYGNESFVEKHVKDHGALGALFWEKKKDIKMGDTPSVLYLLDGDQHEPDGESWGGSYIRGDSDNQYHWIDNPADSLEINGKDGAYTVAKHRKAYLDDWAEQMKRLAPEK